MVKIILILFLVWRIFLFLPIISGFYFLPARTGYDYALLTYFLPKESILHNFLLFPFGNFDGAYYLLIAAGGYTVNAGFFPLFPLSISLIASIFSNAATFLLAQYFAATLLVISYSLVSLLVFYKLIRIDYKENIALWSIVFLLIFPTSFFNATIYSESLFLLLSFLSFYFARKKNWLLACLCGGLLTATRLVGIAILPVLIFEYIKYDKRRAISKLLCLFLTPLGLIGYMVFNFIKWGNPFYFLVAQGNFQNNRTVDSIVLLPQTIFRYIKILFTVNPSIYEWWVALLELSMFTFAVILLLVAWKKKVRLSYILFGILLLVIPASSGTLSGIPRYILPIFPIFIALALIHNKFLKISYFIISLLLLFLLFMLFSKGYFIA